MTSIAQVGGVTTMEGIQLFHLHLVNSLSACFQGLHTLGKALDLDGDLSNYSSITARAESNTHSCRLKKNHKTVYTDHCIFRISLAFYAVTYFGAEILNF